MLAIYEDTEEQYQTEALFAVLIESAFMAGLISGETETLIYEWIRSNGVRVH